MITWALIASTVIALVLVVLVQGKWTSWDSWFAAVFASAVMAGRTRRGGGESARGSRERVCGGMVSSSMQPRTDSARTARPAGTSVSPETKAPITPAARRQRKVRAKRKAGQHHYGMWLSDRAVEGM